MAGGQPDARFHRLQGSNRNEKKPVGGVTPLRNRKIPKTALPPGLFHQGASVIKEVIGRKPLEAGMQITA